MHGAGIVGDEGRAAAEHTHERPQVGAADQIHDLNSRRQSGFYLAPGIPVAHASRCPAGRAGAAYAFPGGGAEWIRAGALPVGHLCAVKARIALALGLGAGLDRAGLVTLLADPET